jgi:hypothetical protein
MAMSRVIDGDQRGATRFPAPASDDAFQQSMARLSLHLATRHSTVLLPPPRPLPSVRRWVGWPYLVLLVLAGAGAAAYHYAVFQGDPLGGTTSTTAQVRPAAAVKAGPPLASLVPTAPVMPSPAPTAEEPPVVKAAVAVPPPEPQPPVEAPTPEAELTWVEVLELQRRLTSLGINAGPLDGITGPRTMAGVQRYQELKGLAATGKADRQMLKLLQQDPGSAGTLEARVQ